MASNVTPYNLLQIPFLDGNGNVNPAWLKALQIWQQQLNTQGTAATHNASDFDPAGAAAAAQAAAETFATNAANTAKADAETFATGAANSAAGTAQGNAESHADAAAATAQSNAEAFASAAITAAFADGISVTITTAKLTTGGTNGSMTFTNGLLTAQVAAT